MNTKMRNCKRNAAATCGWFMTLLLSALLAGCGSGGNGGDAGDGGGTGTLGVSLTDAPACGFDAVNVTVSKVRVHQSGTASENTGGWSEIVLSPARKINLLDLTNGVFEDLGETALPAGHYTQVRLVLAANGGSNPFSNSLVLSSGRPAGEIALVTPSAVQSGIKLNHEFDVDAGQRVDLMLDFDACKSIVRRGNGSFLLKPVITVIPTLLNGISGAIDPAALASNVTVSAQVGGTVVRSTVPETSTGAFFLARLPSGNYDVVITGDNRATVVIAGVPVASSSVALLSNDSGSIFLPASATHSISGNVVRDPPGAADDVAIVTAKHVSGGAQVTVQAQAADLLSGNYALTLPVAAPRLGQYGTGTLPIVFAEQTALAGQYDVEASASGYQTQSFSRDISTADAIQDFSLVP